MKKKRRTEVRSDLFHVPRAATLQHLDLIKLTEGDPNSAFHTSQGSPKVGSLCNWWSPSHNLNNMEIPIEEEVLLFLFYFWEQRCIHVTKFSARFWGMAHDFLHIGSGQYWDKLKRVRGFQGKAFKALFSIPTCALRAKVSQVATRRWQSFFSWEEKEYS